MVSPTRELQKWKDLHFTFFFFFSLVGKLGGLGSFFKEIVNAICFSGNYFKYIGGLGLSVIFIKLLFSSCIW